jgi:hypothetical protein
MALFNATGTSTLTCVLSVNFKFWRRYPQFGLGFIQPAPPIPDSFSLTVQEESKEESKTEKEF